MPIMWSPLSVISHFPASRDRSFKQFWTMCVIPISETASHPLMFKYFNLTQCFPIYFIAVSVIGHFATLRYLRLGQFLATSFRLKSLTLKQSLTLSSLRLLQCCAICLMPTSVTRLHLRRYKLSSKPQLRPTTLKPKSSNATQSLRSKCRNWRNDPWCPTPNPFATGADTLFTQVQPLVSRWVRVWQFNKMSWRPLLVIQQQPDTSSSSKSMQNRATKPSPLSDSSSQPFNFIECTVIQ